MRLTEEQLDARLRLLATGISIDAAADALGLHHNSLYMWVRRNGLDQMLVRHRAKMRRAYQRGIIDEKPWEKVGIELGVSARWAEHLAGLYKQRRKRAA